MAFEDLWLSKPGLLSLTVACSRSGSTGVPKGVMIEHTALSTTILERAPVLGHKPGLRCILYSSYAFDSSVWEIFAPLLHGSCVFIPSNTQRLEALPDYLNEKRIEMFASTPTVVQNILHSPSHYPYLTTLDLGGEAMTKLILSEWAEHVRLVNDYGPTEACIVASMNSYVTPDTDPNNIGYSNGDASHLWVVEPTNYSKLAPIGCTGELLISGPTLARGYLNDQEKTSKAFIDCSAFEWAMEGDGRCYVTGDLVRRNGDGSLTFSGRKDMQIQMNGVRIEIEEIEYVLGRCDGVQLAVVDKVSRGGSGVEMLVAFLTLEGVSDETSSEPLLPPDDIIRSLINNASSKLLGRLPQYMVPKLYLPLHRIPTSTGGKVDRKTLQKTYSNLPRELLADYRYQSTAKRIPRTDVQRTLQAIWRDVLALEVSQIGLDDDFFILGGDSLAAIKLTSKSTERGLGLSLVDVFQAPRLEDMAARIRLKSNVESPEHEDPTPFGLLDEKDIRSTFDNRDGIEDIIPGTSIQASFIIRALRWYHPSYIWFFMDVDNQFTPDCLQLACDAIVQRHRILRTIFYLRARQCYQVVTKNSRADFKVFRCVGEMSQSCCRIIDQDVKIPVKFGQNLTRFRLVINDSTAHQMLCIGLSHAQYDGFCTDSILSELFYSCTGTLDPRKPPSYSRFIKHSIQSSRNTDTDTFWADLLQDSKMASISPHTKMTSAPDDRHVMRIMPTIHKRPSGMGVAIIVKTAWSLVLARLSRSNDLVFGSVVSGRSAPFSGAASVVGPCLNILPVRLRLHPGQKITALMKQAYDQQIATMPYEATPFEQIVRQSPWPPSTRFGSVVLHQNIPDTSVSQDDEGAPKWKYAGAATSNDAVFDFLDCWLTTMPVGGNGEMKCWVSYHEEKMSMKAAEAVLDYFFAVVETICEHPEYEIQSLDTLDCGLGLDKAMQDNDLPVVQDDCPRQSPVPQSPIPEDLFERLRTLWATVLQIAPASSSSLLDQIPTVTVDLEGQEPTFFSLGGDSLAAAQLATTCADVGLDLELQDIYDFPRLSEQCRLLAGQFQRVERERPQLVFVSEKEIPS